VNRCGFSGHEGTKDSGRGTPFRFVIPRQFPVKIPRSNLNAPGDFVVQNFARAIRALQHFDY
jgi:hypothetical protein